MEPRPPVPSPPPPESQFGLPSAGPALVFAGSSERDVALAKFFWNSVTLQPPLESCLGPRRMSGNGGNSAGGPRKVSSLFAARRSLLDTQKISPLAQASATSRKVEEETQGELEIETVDNEKKLFLQKAKRREEIIALLKKQREERIMKESVSRQHKPKIKMEERKSEESESNVEDQESVKALI